VLEICAYLILPVRCSPLSLMATSLAHHVYRNRVPNKYTSLDFFVADASSLSSILRLVEPFGRVAAQSCSPNGPATTRPHEHRAIA
jgi:hypothetical protein